MAKKTSKASASRASSTKKTTKKKVSKKKTATKSAKKATTAASTRKSRSTAASSDGPTKKTTAKRTRSKNPLTKRELTKFRNILMIKRAELRGDLDSMQAEALLNHDSANLSHMPIHMADVGSDQYEQELTLGLVESERRMLDEIEEALHRIEEGTYGLCAETGEPIGKARLEAKPWAKYTIEVAREMERNHTPRR